MGGLEGKPSKYNRGGVTEGCPLLVYNDVLSPLLHPSGGAVRTDLYAEAPHSSDNSVPCPGWVRCMPTAAVLVTFAAKSDIRKDKKTFAVKSETQRVVGDADPYKNAKNLKYFWHSKVLTACRCKPTFPEPL